MPNEAGRDAGRRASRGLGPPPAPSPGPRDQEPGAHDGDRGQRRGEVIRPLTRAGGAQRRAPAIGTPAADDTGQDPGRRPDSGGDPRQAREHDPETVGPGVEGAIGKVRRPTGRPDPHLDPPGPAVASIDDRRRSRGPSWPRGRSISTATSVSSIVWNGIAVGRRGASRSPAAVGRLDPDRAPEEPIADVGDPQDVADHAAGTARTPAGRGGRPAPGAAIGYAGSRPSQASSCSSADPAAVRRGSRSVRSIRRRCRPAGPRPARRGDPSTAGRPRRGNRPRSGTDGPSDREGSAQPAGDGRRRRLGPRGRGGGAGWDPAAVAATTRSCTPPSWITSPACSRAAWPASSR